MYCKSCGEPVSGKYCSNCGKRVTGSFDDYRRAERKMRREFINERAKDTCTRNIATSAWDLATYTVEKLKGMYWRDTFDEKKEQAFRDLERMPGWAEGIYQKYYQCWESVLEKLEQYG